MAGNDMYIHLGLDSSEFDKRLNKTFSDANIKTSKGLTAIIKAQYEFPNAASLQKELAKAMRSVKGLTYQGSKNKLLEIGYNDFSGVEKAYAQLNRKAKANIQLTNEETKAYEKLSRAMRAIANIGSAKYMQDSIDARMRRAVISGEVTKTKRQAAKDPNAADDKAIKQRWRIEMQMQDRAKKEAARQERERLTNIRRNYDREQAEIQRGGSSSAELGKLRSYYQQQQREQERMREQEMAQQRQYAHARRNRAEYDNQINRISLGGSTSHELAIMRQFYQEQEQAQQRVNRAAQQNLLENGRNAQANARLKQSVDELTRAEQAYQNAQKQNKGRNVQQIQQEITALKQLIRAKEKNLRLLHNKAGVTDPALDGYRSQLQTLQQRKQQLQDINNTYGKQSSIMQRLVNLASRYFSVYSVINFGKKVAETTAYFERQRVALEGITGSASKANKVLSELTDFATHSPFKASDLIGFAKQLGAFSIPTDDLVDTTKKLADISAGLGVDMSRIILAYGQVKSASVLRGQELRQFTEAGIPMVDALAKKFTELNGELVTTGEVFDLISKRQVSFEMVDEILTGMSSEGGKFYKMQENLSETMYGQIQKLSDLWAIALNDIGNDANGIFMTIIKALQSIVKNAKSVGVAIGAAFLVNTIGNFSSAISVLIRRLKTTKSISNAINVTWKSIGGVASLAIGAVVGLVAKAIDKSTRLSRELNNIDKSFAKENSRMIDGLDSLVRKLQEAQFGTKAYQDAVNTLSQNYGDFINKDIIQSLNDTDSAARMTADAFAEIAKQVKGAIVSYNEYQAAVQKKEKVKEGIQNKAEAFSSGFIGNNFRHLVFSQNLDKPFVKDYTDRYGTESIGKIITDLDKLRLEATQKFLDGEELTIDSFKNTYRELLQKYYPNTNEMAISNVTSIAASGIDKNLLLELQRRRKDVETTDYYTATHPFESVKPEEIKTGGDTIDYRHNLDIAYIEALQTALNSKFKEIPDELSNAISSGIKNFDNNSVATINKLLDNFRNTFTDPDTLNWLATVRATFNQHVGQKTGRAAKVSNLIEGRQDWRNDSVLSGLASRFNPTDETYEKLREQVKTEYEDLTKELESYVSKGGKDKQYTDNLQKKIAALTQLAGADYYNIDLSNKTRSRGNRGSEQLPEPVADFINQLKEAYTTYKTAAQSQGGALGVAYMQNDKKMIERFNDFFHGATTSASFDGVKIGGKSVGELLQDAFFDSGLEKGVIDFEKAVNAVADTLANYAAQAPKQRRKFADAAKSLRKWGESTFARDNVQAWIEDTNKAFQDLTKTFQRANQQVELYRKLLQNGTAGTLGMFAGGASDKAMVPDSLLQLGNIDEMVALFNERLNAEYDKTGVKQEERKGFLNIDTSSLNTIPAIQAAIANVSAQMKLNKDNFAANPALGETGKTLESMLQNYLTTIISELESISGEKYTGNIMEDLAANLTSKINVGLSSLTMQENVARQYGAYDYSAIKKMVDEVKENANTFFDTFINDQRFDVLAKGNFGKINFDEIKRRFVESIKDLPPILKEELERKLNDLELKVQNFNSSSGVLSSFGGALKSYKNAGGTSKRMYDDELSNYNGIGNKIKDAKSSLAIAQTQENKEEIDRIQKQLDELIAEQTASQEKLNQIGTNGENAKVYIQKQSLADMKASAEEAQSALNTISETVVSTINAFKSLSNAVNKAYDVMNDGENPEWMQDMDSFLSDFAEDFEALIAPIGAVIAMVIAFTAVMAIAGTEVTIALGVIVALIAVFAAVMAAFQQHDRSLQHDIDELDKKIEEFDTAITNLNAAAERQTGFKKLATQIDSVGQSLSKASASAKQADLEEAKKNTDNDKVNEYRQNAQEAMDEFLNSMKDIVDELTASVDDWSNSMSSAIRGAFQNGENAARAFRSTVKEMMGDVIENMLQMSILQPLMDEALEQWTGQKALQKKYTTVDENGIEHLDSDAYLADLMNNINNPDKMKEFEENAKKAGDSYIDAVDQLPDYVKELYSHVAENSRLSGGIESITEDTARRLEALTNSQLGELVIIRNLLQGYIMASSGYGNSTMATIQSAVVQMTSNVALIANMSNLIEKHIRELRNTSVQPLHVTMV